MNDDMGLEEEWLSIIRAESTKKHYIKGLTYFKEFLGISKAEELRDLQKPELKVNQFWDWLLKTKGLNENSATARCVPIQSIFRFMERPLDGKKLKLPPIRIKIEVWRPSLEDLQKVYRLGDISVKAWLSLSRDCPARMGDLLKITPEQIESGEFTILSKKESIVGKVYISDETKALFKQLKEAGIQLPISQHGIDRMMSVACKTAGFQKRLNQHLFRKIWISQAINLGLSEPIVKILSFKSVDKSLLTYMLDRNDLKDAWKKVIDAIPLEKTNGNGKITSVQESVDLVMKVLRKMIEREIGIHGSDALGITKRMVEITDKQLLEEYIEDGDKK